MAAYLASCGNPGTMLNGALVYPMVQAESNLPELQAANPWRLAGAQRSIWFLGVSCDGASVAEQAYSGEERVLIDAVRGMLGVASSR